jgi:hypothetical protein
LPSYQWDNLEQRFGSAVRQRFYQIAESPNLFTEEPTFETYMEPSTEEEKRAASRPVPYHKYDQMLDLTGKDLLGLLDSPKSRIVDVIGPLRSKEEMPSVSFPLRELTSMGGEIAEEVHDFPNATLGGEYKHFVLHFLRDRFIGYRFGPVNPPSTPAPSPWYRRWLGL